MNLYKSLDIIKDFEWDKFYGKLKEPLDICFRINSIDKHRERTISILKEKIAEIQKDPEMMLKVPNLVKWYPNQLAFQFDEVSRLEMRKSPAFKDFHTFLVRESENGRIFRQEKVSMIPVTLMKIEPHHKVLDMCAAPGSKTIQILEYLH